MPYVACLRCAARSYVVPNAAAESCPVCDAPLPPPARRVTGRATDPRKPLSDAELAARHRDGDASAFAALHERYAAPLRRHARRMIAPGPAEDVVQDAFERAHRLLLADERATGDAFVLGAWLHTVVHHRCVDAMRRTRPVVAVCDGDLPSPGLEPHDRAVLSERLDDLGRAVRALPDRQREALVRHVLDGEPHSEIAGRLGVSVAATKGLVNRARNELRHSTAA